MNKIVYFIIFVIIIVVIFSVMYFDYKIKYNSVVKDNLEYEYYYEKEIYGTELASIINKVVDINERNGIEKDSNGLYIPNKHNSINIKIYISDNDTIYEMEKIYNNEIMKFVENYGKIKFKCTKIEFHNSTKRISNLYFKQITE